MEIVIFTWGGFNSDLPIVLFYSLEADEAFSYNVDLTHTSAEDTMREKRLERIGKGSVRNFVLV